MGDIFVERIVKRKVSSKGLMVRALAVLLTVISFFSVLFLGILGITLTILVLYLAYTVWSYTNVEFEYSFVNTELSVDKILGQRKRKHVDDIDIKQAEIIAPANSSEITGRTNEIKVLDYSTGYKSDDLYAMIATTDKGLAKILFNADEKIIDAMRHVRPSIVKKY